MGTSVSYGPCLVIASYHKMKRKLVFFWKWNIFHIILGNPGYILISYLIVYYGMWTLGFNDDFLSQWYIFDIFTNYVLKMLNRVSEVRYIRYPQKILNKYPSGSSYVHHEWTCNVTLNASFTWKFHKIFMVN